MEGLIVENQETLVAPTLKLGPPFRHVIVIGDYII